MTQVTPQFAKLNPTHSQNGNAIEAQDLVRRFGSVTALDQVSLQIRQGEFFSLLGPSGCGKTTLLRIIAGLDAPDEGSLSIDGIKAKEIPAHKRPVNTVFQNYALFPHLTVWDNVAFGLRMKKVEGSEIKSRVERALKLVEITDLVQRKPHQISGGQKQRVALARAIINEPKVLLLDEPLGALDLKLRKQLQIQLHQLQRRLGITFIYVTHDQEEALVMSDRIALMNGGKIEQLDTGQNIYEKPRTRFVAEFLGTCNLITGTVQGNVMQTDFGPLQLAPDFKTGSEGRISIAIRPEKLVLQKTRSAPNGTNTFSAKIEDAIYSGAETQFRVRIGGHIFVVTHLNSLGHAGFCIGDAVLVQFPAAALVVLED